MKTREMKSAIQERAELIEQLKGENMAGAEWRRIHARIVALEGIIHGFGREKKPKEPRKMPANFAYPASSLLLMALLLMLSGCGPSLAQIEGEKAYYAAMQARYASAAAQPLVELTPNSPGEPIVITGGGLKIYQPVTDSGIAEIKQYQHTDYGAKWVSLIGQAVSVAAPWVGVGMVAHEMSKMGNSTTTIKGDGNAAAAHSPNMDAQVADPTVVEAPDPVIVEPEIVTVGE